MNDSFIARVDPNTSYQDFYNEFLVKNKVCICEGLTTDWRSRTEWLTKDGTPDLDVLSNLFGDAMVPVADCQTKYYNSNAKQEMIFNDYIDYWKRVQSIDYHYSDNDMKILYLKDWHFINEFPDYKAYERPIYFESDWINEFCTQDMNSDLICDDFRFVYMGPKHSSTPLHVDVFGSYSWSANICGTKKWLIIPPGNEANLKSLNNNEIPFDFYQIHNYSQHLKSMNGFEVIQRSGDIIFIPSGYIHQVINTEDTISLNHNWFNGTNIHKIFSNLMNALNDVENELSDLKTLIDLNEWHNECQTLLKMHFGMNLNEFFDCLRYVSKRIKSEAMDQQIKERK
ncbi:2-oxoglutarate and iron-dependent oxygenase JMJD4-like [Oppia nitens]|uniref:2-oxoglutarate and iron-dependent oxygenase JMJD4-like n=1 Tax=Oppia nitens TaxID=1686743 RepID=UPI0023DBDFF2|nr:2-oxoglutarate and iron-dependent oxygenase JMJD4-like [Oppia nitens]